MSKNIAKILKQSSDKVYIKESTAGAEPSWVAADEVGYSDDSSLNLDSKKAVQKEGGGADIQVNTDYTLALFLLQVLDHATLLALKNKNCWIMVKPTGTVSATNQEIKIKNFILNAETKIDAKTNGKSGIMISGTRSEYTESDVFAFSSSSTTVS